MSKRRRRQSKTSRSTKPRASEPTESSWPEAVGEAVLIALIVSVPIVINKNSRNICDIKDLVLGLGVALGLAIWLIGSLARGRVTWVRSRLNLAVLAFAAWAGISIVYSRFRYVSLSEVARLMAHVGLFWLAIVTLRSLRQARRLIGAAALAAVPVCLYGFYQAAGHDFITWRVPTTRVFSFLGNPTYLGGFIILLLPMVLAAAWPASEQGQQAGTGRRWIGYVASGLFLAVGVALVFCLYYSATLAAAIGLGMGAAVAVVLTVARGGLRWARFTVPGALVAALVCATAAVLAYRQMPPKQQTRVQQVLRFQDPAGRERRLHRQVALDIFKEQPFQGQGYGTFRVYALERMAPAWYEESMSRSDQMLMPGYAHNEYLQVLADTGMVGGVLFGLLLVAAYALAVRVGLAHPHLGWAVLALGFAAGFTGFLFQNMIGVTFRQTGPVTLFWIWLAMMALAGALIPGPDHEGGGPRLREWRFRRLSVPELIGASAGVALVLVIVSWAAIRPFMASLELRRAQALALAGQFREAALYADRATQLSPYSPLGFYVSGYAWGQVGEYDKAIEANEKALALMPGNASAYYNLAVSYKEKGEFERAADTFQRAIDLMPTNFRHQAAMAEVLIAQGKATEAEAYAREAARLAPENAQVHMLLAEVLGKGGKPKEAARALAAAADLAPTDVKLKQQLAQLLFEVGEHDWAADVCRDWIRSDPTSAFPHNGLGTYYFNRGSLPAAKAEFLRAVELDPNYWRARLNLAYALGRLGEQGGRSPATAPRGRSCRRHARRPRGSVRSQPRVPGRGRPAAAVGPFEGWSPKRRSSAMAKKALITGVTGQDGSYLAELLLEKGYEVHGIIRRSSSFNTGRIDHLYVDPHEPDARLRLHHGDLTDAGSVHSLVAHIRPDEIYHLAAQSHVRVSFDQPIYTSEVVAMGAVNLLEAVRQVGGNMRVYQAGSSEMFGVAEPPQDEQTPFRPRSPYACAKVFAHHLTVNYREAYGIFASNGILFNHESPRRGETFVTRKITRAATRIKLGLQDKVHLGNLAAKRDWGYAPDYVRAMWLMLQQEQPEDCVVATGEAHSVQEFLELVFRKLDLDWRAHVEIDPRYFRPTEVDLLMGDASKARERLGWEPSVGFDELAEIMVQHDLQLARREKAAASVPG